MSHKSFSVALFALIFCLNSRFVKAQYDDTNCAWKKNVTAITDLMEHQFVALEKCLYYYISTEANRKEKRINQGDAIVEIPPISRPEDSVDVTIKKIIVRRVWMNEFYEEMDIEGILKVVWKDPRFQWNPSTWHVNRLRIESMYSVWVPLIETTRSKKQESKFYSYYKDIEATPDGTITAEISFVSGTMCDTDYYNYPKDVNSCCFKLQSPDYPELLHFILHNGRGYVDQVFYQGVWDVQDIRSQVMIDEEDQKSENLMICLTATRSSKTLSMELNLPIWISAIVVVSAPLFGGFKMQHFVKLFAIFMQYMIFNFLVSKTPHLGFGNSIPKIYRFYEFSIAMTLVSLLATLLIDAISRMEWKFPPPHNLFLMASAVNSRCCCSQEERPQAPVAQSNGVPGPVPPNCPPPSTRTDWLELFVALNNGISLLIMLIYIVGALVLCT